MHLRKIPALMLLLLAVGCSSPVTVAPKTDSQAPRSLSQSLDNWKTVVDIAESMATVMALILGGTWTYFLFVHNRLAYPRVQVKIAPLDILLPNQKRLIHAAVTVKNVSKVKMAASKAELRLRVVVPLTNDIEETVNRGYDPVPLGRTELEFPMIAGRKWTWGQDEFEIEPEDDDTLHADFVIDASTTVVEFYFFIENAKKQKEGLGWPATLLHEFVESERLTMSNEDTAQKTTSEIQIRQQMTQEEQDATITQKPKQSEDAKNR